MDIVINCDLQSFIEYIKTVGYYKNRKGAGYCKQVKGGRLHILFRVLNKQNVCHIHFDKFKGNQNKKFHHSSRYEHPKVKKEMKILKSYNDSCC